MKTSELTGAALDWAVAKCEGGDFCITRPDLLASGVVQPPPYSTNWAQGGPIIERTFANVFFDIKDASYAGHREEPWFCEMDEIGGMWHGPTPLIAAMRCHVANKLGAEVELPKELT